MKKTLAVLNELEKSEIVDGYAIGGGIAVLFYIEPIFTSRHGYLLSDSCGKNKSIWNIY